jgi:hypothetical protein
MKLLLGIVKRAYTFRLLSFLSLESSERALKLLKPFELLSLAHFHPKNKKWFWLLPLGAQEH